MLSLDEVVAKYKAVTESVFATAEKFGRNPAELQIVLATKTQPSELLEGLHRVYPNLIFAENRVQELQEKYNPEFRWQFIGQLQTNKVKYIIDKVELIHSLDRTELAQEINRRADSIGKVQDCLIEVNMAGEVTKGGLPTDRVESFLEFVSGLPNIRIRGLMSVLPMTDDYSLRCHYEHLKVLYDAVKASYRTIDILSAGMSNDYLLAVEYGSNMLRLGSAVFGPRTM